MTTGVATFHHTSGHTVDSDDVYVFLAATIAELTRSCVKVEVAALGSVPNKPTVSVDVTQHFNHATIATGFRLNEEHGFSPKRWP